MSDNVAAIGGDMTETTGSGKQNGNGFSSTAALVAYLRSEAELAEKKAKRLREQANNLARQFGITEADQSAYEYPSHMAPLDENGVPKYKGKKRGRKPKARKRKANPNRRKRQHTAYTLFVQETYPIIKSAYPEYPSKDVISIVAKQWKTELSLEEKAQWRARAVETHGQDDEEGGATNAAAPPPAPIQHDEAAIAAAAAAAAAEDDDDDEEEEEPLMHEEDEEELEDDGVDAGEEEAETEDESAAHARRRKRERKK